MAVGCANAIANIATRCSRSSNIRRLRRTPDNNSSERSLRPTATYRKVTGGFRSIWGADLYAAIRSTVGTAAKQGIHAFDAIRAALQRMFPLSRIS